MRFKDDYIFTLSSGASNTETLERVSAFEQTCNQESSGDICRLATSMSETLN